MPTPIFPMTRRQTAKGNDDEGNIKQARSKPR
jgi:hypothetical protein